MSFRISRFHFCVVPINLSQNPYSLFPYKIALLPSTAFLCKLMASPGKRILLPSHRFLVLREDFLLYHPFATDELLCLIIDPQQEAISQVLVSLTKNRP